MSYVLDEVKAFFETWNHAPASQILTLRQAGSNRMYLRAHTDKDSYIITYNPNNVSENNAFIEFSRHFHRKKLPVPEILHADALKKMYIQTDLGDDSLFDQIQKQGFSKPVKDLYKQTFDQLAKLQVLGGQHLDYSHCIATRSFDKQAIYSDLLYFLYYFVRALDLAYDKNLLLNDFELLSSYLMQEEANYFMHRDCQSRNIMLKDGEVFFIDYQGGMQGALQYDVASMLWQARAGLPHDWRDELAEHYFDSVNTLLGGRLNKQNFLDSYDGFVLIRMLQTLGAYGFRGLFERKSIFLSSIPIALKQLRWFLEHKKIPIRLPELQKVLWTIVSDEIIEKYEIVKAGADCPLVVEIKSFSYRNGIPEDEHGNGGGFIFDCRGIYNPGRFTEYKQLTGRDKEVQEFLLHRSEMPNFLQHVYGLVDISVQDYIKRGFEHLTVSFGCTGGQHRSVYAADSLAKHLQEKFGVKVKLNHIEQESKNWINP